MTPEARRAAKLARRNARKVKEETRMEKNRARRTGRNAAIMAEAIGAPSVSPWVMLAVEQRKAAIWKVAAVVAGLVLVAEISWRIFR